MTHSPNPTPPAGHWNWPWSPASPPWWAQNIQYGITQLITQQEEIMAGIGEIRTAFGNLIEVINQALQQLKDKATAGGLSPEDVQAVINDINAEHDEIVAKLTPPTPPAPTT